MYTVLHRCMTMSDSLGISQHAPAMPFSDSNINQARLQAACRWLRPRSGASVLPAGAIKMWVFLLAWLGPIETINLPRPELMWGDVNMFAACFLECHGTTIDKNVLIQAANKSQAVVRRTYALGNEHRPSKHPTLLSPQAGGSVLI